MRVFRQFDYFRKSTSPEQIKPTCMGGLISLCCVATLVTLIYNEMITLNEPIFKKNATVSTDPHKNSHILMNIDITFPNVPCFLLDMGMSTSVNALFYDEIQRSLTFSHLNQRGDIVEQFIGSPDKLAFEGIDMNDESKSSMIKKFYDDGLSCHITGTLEPTKVTGQLNIRLTGEKNAYRKFKNEQSGVSEDMRAKVQLNHYINSITFGKESEYPPIKRTFGQMDDGQHTMFNMFAGDKVNESLKNDPEDTAQEYFYFLKLVPHVFVDHIEQVEHSSYSYSLNHNKKDTEESDMVSVTVIIDYAPIKMILSKQVRPTGSFLIDMCSIVGGVFVIFGLLNGFMLRCCAKCKMD